MSSVYLAMMKIAVVSDIHANLHALERVFSEISKQEPDQIWCLGDTVGYGAFPSECLEMVRSRCDLILSGNHDLAVAGAISLDDFNIEARRAVEWTAERLTEIEKAFLKSLPAVQTVEIEGVRFVVSHGSPLNPVWEYVLGPRELNRVFYYLQQEAALACLTGHSHVQFYASSSNGSPEIKKPFQNFELQPEHVHVINPGSVGQPRDYDPRAAFCVLEIHENRVFVEFSRTEYDIEEAARSIIDEGLPVFLAARLRSGY